MWARANETRRRHVGDAVHLRGLIEISNRCTRQCAYCGLRAGNTSLCPIPDGSGWVFVAALQARRMGYGTVVLQAGEDSAITAEWMADVIRQIKSATPLAVTLSLGERRTRNWKPGGRPGRTVTSCGSRPRTARCSIRSIRRIGRQESDRLAILRRLKKLGYETGSGIMVGIPGQTSKVWRGTSPCSASWTWT